MTRIIDTVKNRIRKNALFWFSAFGIWLFYLWILRETPYEIDDWFWGIPEGWQALLTGEVNGRYFSNLLEAVAARSALLKTLLIGTLASLLPYISTILCMHFSDDRRDVRHETDGDNRVLPVFLLAVLLFLSPPLSVWRQTYGWIAGFSNFGFAGIALLIYQGLLLHALRSRESTPKALIIGTFLFGIAVQLILENITIYALTVTATFFLEEAVRKRKTNPILLTMLLGNLVGTAVMFSGSIYGTLMETGSAVDGLRGIKINRDIGLLANLLVIQKRFVFFFPQNIWSNNWILSSAISFLLASHCLKKKSPLRIMVAAGFFLFVLLFCFMRFIGPLEQFVPGWSDIFTQRLNLLYFWLVIGVILLLWWDRKIIMAALLFLWVSAPAVILPLAATNIKADAARCFLTSSVFQVEFCLLLFLNGQILNSVRSRNSAVVLLAAGILFSCTQKLVIYHDIDAVRRERAELVRKAQQGETTWVDFPDFPHGEYLWVTEPIGETQRTRFRTFYQIPDEVEIHFNTEEENNAGA